MRDTWHAAKVERLQFPTVEPEIPTFAKTYNHCEPQVVAVTLTNFNWYENPTVEWQQLIKRLQAIQIKRQKSLHPNMTFPAVSWLDNILATERIALYDEEMEVMDVTNSLSTMVSQLPTRPGPQTRTISRSIRECPETPSLNMSCPIPTPNISGDVSNSLSHSMQDDRDDDESTESSGASHDFSKSTLKRRASTSTPKRDDRKQRKKNLKMAKVRF